MRPIDQSNSNSELSKDDANEEANRGNQSPKQPDKKRRSEIDSNRIEETINEAEAGNMAQNNGDAVYPPVGLEVEKAAINKSSIKVITKVGDKESSSKLKPNRNEQNQIEKTNSLLNVTGLSDQSEFSKNLIIASASSDEVNRDNTCNKNGNNKENLAEEKEVNSEKEEGIQKKPLYIYISELIIRFDKFKDKIS